MYRLKYTTQKNCIGGVMGSMLTSIVGTIPDPVKPKTIKLVFVASLLRPEKKYVCLRSHVKKI